MKNIIMSSKLKIISLFLTITFIFFSNIITHHKLYAQPPFQVEWSIGRELHHLNFIPSSGETAIGWGLGITYSISNSPFSLGASFTSLKYGHEEFAVIVPNFSIDMDLENNILQWHIMLRLISKSGKIRPYLEGLIGFNYLSTQTIFKDPENGRKLGIVTNKDDLVFSYGAGFGFMIKLFDAEKSNGTPGIFLNLKGRYLLGDRAEFFKDNVILNLVEDPESVEVTKSETNLLMGLIGILIEF